MDTQKIRDLIDKVIGKDGPLRVPAYWMHKLLKDTVDWAGEKFGKLDTKVDELETNLNTTSTGLSELTKEFEEYSAPKTYKTAKIVLSWSNYFYSTSGVVSGYRYNIENVSDLFVNGESKIEAYVDIYAKCADDTEYLLIKDSNLRTVFAPVVAPIGFSGMQARLDTDKSFYAVHVPTGLPVVYSFTSRMSVVNPYPTYIYCGFAYTTTDICFTSQYPEHNVFETNRFYPQYDPASPIIQKGISYGRCTYVDGKDTYTGIFNFNTSVLTLMKDENVYTATYNQSTGVVGDLIQSEELNQSNSGVYTFDSNSWNGEESYNKLNDAYKEGKVIVCDGSVMVPVGGSDLVELNGSITMPFGNGTQTIVATISFNSDYSLKLESLTTTIETEGDGTKFLSNDGTYKFVETNPFEIPSEGVLPETGKVGKIYLIPATTTGTDNLMYEYIWANDAWEKLGEFKADVDLSGYYTKGEVDTKTNSLNTKITSAETNLGKQISDLSESKLDKEVANETLATKDEVIRKQNTLVSGVNIKTINEESLLGSGNITIDTSVLNSTGVSQTKAMSQKATTDVLNEEITRATTKENELEGRIFAHESITQDAYDTAAYAETLAIDSNERSQNAENTANSAMNAVRTLEGLSNTDTAQTTLAGTVAQIEQNTLDIKVLQEMFVLITEDDYELLEVKDPTKIYLMYEE